MTLRREECVCRVFEEAPWTEDTRPVLPGGFSKETGLLHPKPRKHQAQLQELNGPTVTKSTFLKPLNLLGTDLDSGL